MPSTMWRMMLGARSLVEAVYADARFRPLMRHAPVTVDAHHAYAGGAIQHTVAVATICREVSQLHPRLDEAVVAAGALTFCTGAADAFLPGAALQLGDFRRIVGAGTDAGGIAGRHQPQAAG